ncbi:hypothetical protein DPMN_083491 [Dreissena polymorpha]|uniref:Uncharacterized protein n=1 Tax=Dreissena polymorpha TaxID=45954 RepID=A0A9D3Y8V7_DREPO|nr:hypothetical protein DPMN_083491 [Dreissena polymorpha]
MRGRGARRKTGAQKRPRSVSPDGNRLNEGDKGKKVIDFDLLLREAENRKKRVPNGSSTAIVTSEPLHVSVPTFSLQQPSQSTMTAASNITVASAAMQNIGIVSDDVAAHIPDQLKEQIGQGEFVNFALL